MTKTKLDRAAILDEYEVLKEERDFLDHPNTGAVVPNIIRVLVDARIAELREVLAGKRRYRAVEVAVVEKGDRAR